MTILANPAPFPEAAHAPRILVVEDSPEVARALATLLRQQGFDPVTFHAAGPAIEFARSNVASAALLDIHLPDQSGLLLSQTLRQAWGNQVPIILLSGDNSMDTLRAIPADGATTFFSKPVNAGVLLQHLKNLLAARAG